MINENFIVLEGRNKDKLIKEGLEELNKKIEQVDIEILERGRTIAGISIKKYKIKMKAKDCSKDNCFEVKVKIEKEDNEMPLSEIWEDEEDLIDKDIGSFDITYLSDGVYLTVHPGEIIRVSYETVIEKVAGREIDEVNYDDIRKIVSNAEGKPVKIAPSQQEKVIDSKVDIAISNDKMEGYMIITPSYGGKDLSLQEVMNIVTERIKVDIDEEAIRQTLNGKKYNDKILIAKGKLPIDGVDGYIKYNFNDNRESTPQVLEDGSVNFRDLNLISNIAAGDILAEKILPTQGSDGVDVLGGVIKHKVGKEETLKYGNNIVLSDDGTKLITQVDGQVTLENGKVVVHDVYSINSDVDNSTGNVEFNGSIKIKGNVITGFKVTAKGNIEIDGVVEGAVIKSDGNIIIKRGVQGYNVAELEAKGNIVCKYIENAKLYSEGDIHSEAIMHSEIVSGNSVIVGGRKGLIVGGSCKASKKIDAKIIGSNMATATLLEVGLDPKLRIDQENLKSAVKNTEIDIDKFDKIVKHLTRLNTEGGLTEEKKEMLNKSIKAKLQLEQKLEILKAELQNINNRIENASMGEIKVEDTIYPGIRVIMGNSSTLIQEEMNRCTIYMDKQEGQIRIGAY
ncbi:protein of unknown function DUF342 [Gottschalkia acidurici 9a]|uniref:Flagellar Assembly Protein A N-terminal region domain-containing protein n=1 Tax=Gottschalkia acidurici (strain ATCC 7906 / DSM 604 / BCRC 14475 / CIP 104303 / KCTC 5404 / NCIMB 10678 / 9a) TaxID=1128398 RepID=K0B0I4_GOTA9|nr:FapA family protein [Gottschalkia acidurici]AFS78582.1 protein of unknown function DUF342 [Gottschalkia acidurici 9a]